MGNLISVHLTGRAKIDGKWRQPGEDVDVTPEVAGDLAVAGAIDEGDAQAISELAPGMPGYDAAVAAMSKTLADAAVLASAEAATAELIADRDAYRIRASDADAEVNRQAARILELEADAAAAAEQITALQAEIAALTSENTEGGQSPNAGQEAPAQEEPATPPKNTRKKGAGAADQG